MKSTILIRRSAEPADVLPHTAEQFRCHMQKMVELLKAPQHQQKLAAFADRVVASSVEQTSNPIHVENGGEK